MIYFVKHKRTKHFGHFKSIRIITESFDMLKRKKCTIENRFRELEKEKKPLIINDWGFEIYRSKGVEK